jgi:hypothetical protein
MLYRILLATAVLVPSILQADVASAPAPTAKDLKEAVENVNYVETAQKGIVLSGYVDAGYTYNFIGRDTGSTFTNRPTSDGQAGGAFHMNALKLVLEKPLTDANEWQAGFRTDLFVGEDAANANFAATGSDTLYLHQAFAQFRVPVGNGIDVQVGKFSTTLGYEVIERPANMNITYSNIYQLSLPLWHVGALAKYKVDENIGVKFGVVNGINTDGLSTTTSAPAFLASLDLANTDGNASISNNVYVAPNSKNDGPNFGVGNGGTLAIYDIYGSWAPKFANDKLLLAFEADIGNVSGNVPSGTGTTTWWDAALYAKYQFTDVFSLAGRGEYFHNDNGLKVIPATFPAGSADLWSWTLTAGFDVVENLTLRAEYRLDVGTDIVTGTAGTAGFGQTFAAEVAYSF